MNSNDTALAALIAKEDIRELALLYSRGVDRKDAELLKTLYAKGATDNHGKHYNGDAEGYVRFLEKSFPYMPYSGHHICNHLISVDGDRGEGEVYALAIHAIPDGKGGFVEDIMAVRYVDRYSKEDGRWKFSSRVVSFDYRSARPIPSPNSPALPPGDDPSYLTLSSRLFARGSRT